MPQEFGVKFKHNRDSIQFLNEEPAFKPTPRDSPGFYMPIPTVPAASGDLEVLQRAFTSCP